MATKISKRDWEALSAYIDGQLSTRERVHLESRLTTEANLQSVLEHLRRTRAMLGSLPKLRAPRNYTLTPQMVPARKARPRSYPVLSLASALATFLLVLVLVGDFFAPRQLAMAPAMETQVAEAAAEPQIQREVPPGAGGGVSPDAVNGKTLEVAPAPTQSPQATPGFALDTQEVAPAEEPAAELMEELPPTPSPSGARIEAYPAPGDTDETELLPTPEEEIVPDATLGRNLIFRILEIGLGIIAVVTGVAAFLIRRGTGG